ncbi:MAG: hypothetical protein GX573_22800 [Chloroflexi bacterium]|nr:hypothetical protein [Chloroflexota bacterium]
MNARDYAAFTETLTRTLERDPRVLGLMAAGSMAGLSHQPDEWSDHDFWVVVEPDAVAWFRAHRDWLPGSDHIVLYFIDAEYQGLTAIYDSGHLAEFAVSDRDGLRTFKVNDYRLLIDRVGLAADLERLQQATTAGFQAAIQDDASLLGRFLTNLLIGMGRYRRGEYLSARQFISVWTLHPLLRLIAKHVPAEGAAALDNLDPMRRFEMAYPKTAGEINALLRLDLDRAAAGLLDLAERLLRGRVAAYPDDAARALRQTVLAGVDDT